VPLTLSQIKQSFEAESVEMGVMALHLPSHTSYHQMLLSKSCPPLTPSNRIHPVRKKNKNKASTQIYEMACRSNMSEYGIKHKCPLHTKSHTLPFVELLSSCFFPCVPTTQNKTPHFHSRFELFHTPSLQWFI
jgi:hypothetical protein